MDAVPSPDPACCAGLRQALLHDWHSGFPLHDSPFQLVARRLGATLREVLMHCHALEREGALDGIRVSWGPAMQRLRWRCARRLAEAPQPALLASLHALPGVTEWHWAEPMEPAVGAHPVLLWFDLLAHDASAAARQRAWFEARHGAFGCAAEPGTAVMVDPCPCEAAGSGGPCQDLALARRCEQSLPLVAHPYRALGEGLAHSEREVLVALRRWRAAGLVQGVGLWPTAAWSNRQVMAALLELPARDERVAAALLSRPGVSEVLWAPAPHPGAQWLVACASGAPVQAAASLERAFAASGLAGLSLARPRLHRLHHVRARAGAQYFTSMAAAA